MKKIFFLIIIALSFCISIQAQEASDSSLIQFSGMVLDGSNEHLQPVPYTNILILREGRGTYSDFKGFFSIVVEKGDEVEFSAIGFRPVKVVIPDTLNDNRYSMVQLMTKDTINLPETVVFPWPSREHFKLEFLAMDVSSAMEERALANLAEESLNKMRNKVTVDANEHADYYMRKQAKSYYHIGQNPPMNIFNPFAWKEFFEAWKKGDFKKKKNKDKK